MSSAIVVHVIGIAQSLVKVIGIAQSLVHVIV